MYAIDRQRNHLRPLGGLRWTAILTAILLVILGVGGLVYGLIEACAAILH
jgi:hypothetical protein